MEIYTIIAKVYLIIAGIATIYSINQPRQPITKVSAVIGLGVLWFFYYLISH